MRTMMLLIAAISLGAATAPSTAPVVKEERIYLTGVSMGAYGVWTWACHDPQRFAAIAPLAGEGNDDLAPRLKHVPVWAFHGAQDPAVAVTEEERMVKAVQRTGGDA